MTEPMDFEEFAAKRCAYPDFGDAGMHKTSNHVSRAAHNRAMRREIERGRDLQTIRSQWMLEYKRLVEIGELRPLTALERTQRAAAGHPDNSSTQAAIRVLAKRAARIKA